MVRPEAGEKRRGRLGPLEPPLFAVQQSLWPAIEVENALVRITLSSTGARPGTGRALCCTTAPPCSRREYFCLISPAAPLSGQTAIASARGLF
jgi:hypothetical protein